VSKEELHAVFGANGGAGRALVRELAAQGKPVRAVVRSRRAETQPGLEVIVADAMDKEATRNASKGASVIYHAVNVPYNEWEQTLPTIMDNLIEAAASSGARLVYSDNLYMYGKVEGSLHEDLPYQPEGKKGALRAKLANLLLRAHEDGVLQAVIGRSSDFLGPGATNTITGLLVIEPALKGKKAMWIGSLDSFHSLSYINDVARGLIMLGEREEAPGEIWHIPAGEPITGRQFIGMVFAHLGKPPRYGLYRPMMMKLVSVISPMARETQETLYQFAQPFILDSSKFQRAFGPFTPTPHPQAIEETIHWFRERLGNS
jgi:nucleoside-diphosphate-sugar epimerase